MTTRDAIRYLTGFFAVLFTIVYLSYLFTEIAKNKFKLQHDVQTSLSVEVRP